MYFKATWQELVTLKIASWSFGLKDVCLQTLTYLIFPLLTLGMRRDGEMFICWTLLQPFRFTPSPSLAIVPKGAGPQQFKLALSPSSSCLLPRSRAGVQVILYEPPLPNLQTEPQKIEYLSAGLSPQTGFSREQTCSTASSKVSVGADSLGTGEWQHGPSTNTVQLP